MLFNRPSAIQLYDYDYNLSIILNDFIIFHALNRLSNFYDFIKQFRRSYCISRLFEIGAENHLTALVSINKEPATAYNYLKNYVCFSFKYYKSSLCCAQGRENKERASQTDRYAHYLLSPSC